MAGRKRKTRLYNPSFGSFIRAIRKVRFPDSTIEQFANMLGITGPYQTRIELGQVPPPSREIVLALAEVIKVNPRVLLALAGWPQSDFAVTIQKHDGSSHSISDIYLNESTDTTFLGSSFGIDVTPEMLRYWAALLGRIAYYIDSGEIVPEAIKLDHSNILNFALFCAEDPFPRIRSEVIETMQTKMRGTGR